MTIRITLINVIVSDLYILTWRPVRSQNSIQSWKWNDFMDGFHAPSVSILTTRRRSESLRMDSELTHQQIGNSPWCEMNNSTMHEIPRVWIEPVFRSDWQQGRIARILTCRGVGSADCDWDCRPSDSLVSEPPEIGVFGPSVFAHEFHWLIESLRFGIRIDSVRIPNWFHILIEFVPCAHILGKHDKLARNCNTGASRAASLRVYSEWKTRNSNTTY